MTTSSRLVSASEAARLLDTTTGALAKRRTRHEDPPFEMHGNRVYYRLADILPEQPDTPVELTPLLRPTQVADLLAVSESALTHMRFRGDGPDWVNISRSVRYAPAAIERYIANNTTRAGASS